MYQDDSLHFDGQEAPQPRQRWTAPEVRAFAVDELTKADSSPGDDGLGAFTHS